MDELPPEARRPDFEAAVEELKKLSRNSGVLDNRVVDTRDCFADGKSIRVMAEECGLNPGGVSIQGCSRLAV